MNVTQIPPHDKDLERSVLAAVFDSPEAFDDLRSALPGPDAFYDFLHRTVFTSLCELAAEGKPLDLAAVSTNLHAKGLAEDVGGWGKLTELCGSPIRPAAIPEHADQLRKLHLARQLGYLGQHYASEAWNRKADPDELRAQFEKELFELGTSGSALKPKEMAEIMASVMDRIDAYSRGEKIGIPTGFIDVDNMIGGMAPGELIILAGRPGQGKSMLAVNIVTNLLENEVPSYLFNLEMGNEEVGERMVCAIASIDHFALRTGRLPADERDKALKVAMNLQSAPVVWQDRPTLKPSELLSALRLEKRKKGIKLAVVDHLLLMGNDEKYNTENDRVGEISRMLKLAAKDVGITVLALCQMNRAIDRRADEMPRLSDLRDSGNIEADADVVMFLHKQSSEPDGVSTLFIAKQRNGPTAMIRLVSNKKSFRFHNYAG
jgi:replicative DNA helicase